LPGKIWIERSNFPAERNRERFHSEAGFAVFVDLIQSEKQT